jgi:hypothetical protein
VRRARRRCWERFGKLERECGGLAAHSQEWLCHEQRKRRDAASGSGNLGESVAGCRRTAKSGCATNSVNGMLHAYGGKNANREIGLPG